MASSRTLALCVLAVVAALCAGHSLTDLHRRLDASSKVVFTPGESASSVFHTSTSTAMFIVMTESASGVAAVSSHLEAGNTDPTQSHHIGMVHKKFNATMHGLVCSLSPSAALGLSTVPGVVLVEQDGPVYAPPSPVTGRRMSVDADVVSAAVGSESEIVEAAAAGSQQNPPWDLNRLDQVSQPLNGWYMYNEDGTGVDIYVVDSGVNTALTDVSRTQSGWSYTTTTTDCFGHGTAVASIAGGTVNGVAKGSGLIAVRVLDCTGAGTMSTAISGLEWVLTQANANLGKRRSVINLSLTGPVNTAMNAAVASLTSAGHVVVAAAGNSATDACQSSPASEPTCIAVAATDSNDARTSFSSWGTCVDVYAPGDSVTVSDFSNPPSGTIAMAGTSFSSPVVAGVVARFLNKYPNAPVADVRASLQCSATYGIVALNIENTPNYLVNIPQTNMPYLSAGSTCVENSCPGGCGAGTCMDAWCECPCFWMGTQCSAEAKYTTLPSTFSGSVTGSNVNLPSYFGEPSGDAYFVINIPSGATTVTLNTCGSATNFITMMWFFDSCPSQQLTKSEVMTLNTEGMSCSSSSTGNAATLTLTAPAGGTYYLLVEGLGSQQGSFTLNWQISGGSFITPSPVAGVAAPSSAASASVSASAPMSQSHTPASSASPSTSHSSASSSSPSPSHTVAASTTSSASSAASASHTPAASASPAQSVSSSSSHTAGASSTNTASHTPPASSSPSSSHTQGASASNTASSSSSSSHTQGASASSSSHPSSSPATVNGSPVTASRSYSPSISLSSSISHTRSNSRSVSAVGSVSGSHSPTPSFSHTSTASPTLSNTHSISMSPSHSLSGTPVTLITASHGVVVLDAAFPTSSSGGHTGTSSAVVGGAVAGSACALVAAVAFIVYRRRRTQAATLKSGDRSLVAADSRAPSPAADGKKYDGEKMNMINHSPSPTFGTTSVGLRDSTACDVDANRGSVSADDSVTVPASSSSSAPVADANPPAIIRLPPPMVLGSPRPVPRSLGSPTHARAPVLTSPNPKTQSHSFGASGSFRASVRQDAHTATSSSAANPV